MSVPGRIGIILIVALALVDAFILASGARHAASAVETHAMVSTVETQAPPIEGDAVRHERLLSTALRQINLFRNRRGEKPTGI